MGPLGLPIHLRMVAARKHNPSPKELPKLLPKTTCKPRIPIMEHLLWYPKQDNYMLKEQMCTLFSGQCPLPHRNRYKANKFRQPVHNGKDPVEPRTTHGEVGHEIHAPAMEPTGRDWEVLQDPSRGLGAVFGSLTNLTA